MLRIVVFIVLPSVACLALIPSTGALSVADWELPLPSLAKPMTPDPAAHPRAGDAREEVHGKKSPRVEAGGGLGWA